MHSHHTTQQLKTCTKCGQELPATLEFFHAQKAGKFGLSSRCKECVALYYQANRERALARNQKYRAANRGRRAAKNREWYLANREKILAKQRAYRLANKDRIMEKNRAWKEANRGKLTEYFREWYCTNRDRAAAVNKIYRQANPEKIQARNKRWKKRNPERCRVYHVNYRARKRNAPGTHTAADVQSLYAAQEGRCAYCGVEVGESYHVDHIVPLSRGGGNGPGNLAIACVSCNTSKGGKLLEEWNKC